MPVRSYLQVFPTSLVIVQHSVMLVNLFSPRFCCCSASLLIVCQWSRRCFQMAIVEHSLSLIWYYRLSILKPIQTPLMLYYSHSIIEPLSTVILISRQYLQQSSLLSGPFSFRQLFLDFNLRLNGHLFHLIEVYHHFGPNHRLQKPY